MARLNQPAFDIITGAEIPSQRTSPRQPLRETMKQSTTTRPDVNNEDLRAQLRTVQYELAAIKQERELNDLRQQQELRDAQNRAEADFKRAQTAETANTAATRKAEAFARDFQEAQDRAANEKLQLEKKVRSLQDDNRTLRDELEEAKADLEGQGRQSRHAFSELEQRHATLQASVEDIQQDLSGRVTALQTAQQKLASKEAEVGELENEVLRLKAQKGDSDTLAVIKKELTEQVTYIKKLEATNRDQLAELKQFRKTQKGIQVVEEEKRALEAKVRMMDDLRKELAESQLQKRILEDEKKGWTSYLETEAADEEDLRYETPEQMARAFLAERLERLSLLDKLGTVQPELSVKDDNIRALQDEKAQLQAELEKARSSNNSNAPASSGDARARARLERQKNLVMKEVEYLRAQMKTFEDEEAEFTPDQTDEARTKRIHDLESMVEQYRNEVETLRSDLSKLETQAQAPPSQPAMTPRKRPRADDSDEGEEESSRLTSLRAQTQTLQSTLDTLQTRNKTLEAELHATQTHLTTLKESQKTRILSLRSNPTSDFEHLKLSTLRTLREENAALLASNPSTKNVVPRSTLENTQQQLAEKETQIAQLQKKDLRIKQIWTAKSQEFREAVCSILGWKLDFQPNGRVKATSILYPKLMNRDGEEEENSIVFDGEKGTMKVSGGPKSLFAGEIQHMIDFWVEGRKEIPCFLAACTLEFYEKTTRAMNM